MAFGLLANRFGLLGAFVGKYAIPSVLLSLALLIPSLISAVFWAKFEVGLDEGFVPKNAPSRREINVQKEFFGETNQSKEWYMALFGVAKSPEGNLLQADNFGELNAFYERVTQHTVLRGPRGNFTYAQICDPLCEINDQLQKLMDNVWLKALGQVQMRYPVSRVLGYDVNIGKHVFNRTVDERGELIGAKIVAFYFASFSREVYRERELELFEQAVEREVEKHNTQRGRQVELIAHGSNTVSKEMARGVLDAATHKLIGLALAVLSYLALHSFAGWLSDNALGRRLLLALLSLCLPVLSLLASVGFISALGLPVSFLFFTSPLLLFSFLLTANGTFQFTSAWCRLLSESKRKHFSASDQLASTFDQIGPSFLSVHLPPVFAFLLLFCFLPAQNYRILAAFLAFLHINTALLQVFLFAPFLALLCHQNSAHFPFENGNSNEPILGLSQKEELVKKAMTNEEGPKAELKKKSGKEPYALATNERGKGQQQKGGKRSAKRTLRQCFVRKAIRKGRCFNKSYKSSDKYENRLLIIYCSDRLPFRPFLRPSDPLGAFVSSLPGKCLVLSASALLLWLSLARGVPLLSNGMDFRRLLPHDSVALRGFDLMDTIWMDFLQILYVIRRPPNFEDGEQFANFRAFLAEATSLPQAVAPRAHQSWLFDYLRDQLGFDLFAQLPPAKLSSLGVNMTKFGAFINGFPYRAWRSGVHFTFREGQSTPSIEQMVVLVAYNGTQGLIGKRSLIGQCRAVAKHFPEFLISVFDTDSRTADIMNTMEPFVWRSLFALVSCAFLVPLLVFHHFFYAFLYAFSSAFVFINLFGIGHFLGFQFDLATAPSAILIGLFSVQIGAHFLAEYVACWAKEDRLQRSLNFSLQIIVTVVFLCFLSILPPFVLGRVPFFVLLARLFLLGLSLAVWLCAFLLPVLASFIATN